MADEVAKGEEPQGVLAKLGAALPVALAAVATTFAGMSSSEMSRAMYWRSAAAQDQAKATSQWTLAGFKRDRALIAQGAAAAIRAAGNKPPVPTFVGPPNDPGRATAARWLAGDGPPAAALPPVTDERLSRTLETLKDRGTDSEFTAQAAEIPFPVLDSAIRDSEAASTKLDKEWGQVLQSADGLVAEAATPAAQTARFDLESRRYLAEAKLNQGISQLYEVRVRRTTAESDRYRSRSENFFYAMLVAQVGATGGSLALARHKRSALWLLAGLTGLVSVAFGGYVYLTF